MGQVLVSDVVMGLAAFPNSVSFSLTPDDLVTFNRVVVARVPSFRAIVWARRVILPLALALLEFGRGARLQEALLVGAIAIAIWLPFTNWTGRMRMYRMWRSAPGLVGEYSISISPTGLRQRTSLADSTVEWKNISALVNAESQILFFVDRRHAFIVPKRTFARAAEAQAFEGTARSWWAAEHGSAAKSLR